MATKSTHVKAFLLALFLLMGAIDILACHAGSGLAVDAGEGIYQRGILGSGAPLVTYRAGGVRIEGADAACSNCHRRSGFGAKEGRFFIPPVTSRYLLRASTPGAENRPLPFVETMRLDRDPPYTEATLAKAIRDGIGADGKPLNYLMPRFALDDADMAALIGYLKRLDQRKSPGVMDGTLHFATIVTPDADPVKKRGMLDVMHHYFDERNAAQLSTTPRLRSSLKTSWANRMFLVNSRWELHVWQLSGPPDSWEAQLQKHFAEEPVLAVVSGLGGNNWTPVHVFCEHQAVPCLFPNVEVPPANADHDFYSLYFSKGVLLEAELIATKLLKPDKGKAAKVVQQVYRAGDSGEAAAQALAAALRRQGVTVKTRVLPRGAPGQGVADAAHAASSADALVLWLRPADITALGKAPPASELVFMSGLMGGLDAAPLPPSWRSRTQLAYTFDLPEKRRVPLDYALGWFRIRNIPVVAEQVQADTYLACGLLSETLRHMVDTFVPEYLVERVQDMLAHRIMTGYYPRLSLAQGQRFASKGGYIVHFSEPEGKHVIADNGWVVP